MKVKICSHEQTDGRTDRADYTDTVKICSHAHIKVNLFEKSKSHREEG